jgi:hypothetical protein
MGKAQLLVDGTSKGTFSNYSSKAKFHVARTVQGLRNGKHTVTVKVLGVKGAKIAKGTFVAVDAFTVGKTRTATPTLVTTLRSIASKSFLGGHATVADLKGVTVTLAFRGTGIVWTTMKSVTQGKAAVYIDGKLKATYDDYAAKTAYKVTRSISKLFDKVHTLRIVVLGTHHKGGKGNLVTVDQFKVV